MSIKIFSAQNLLTIKNNGSLLLDLMIAITIFLLATSLAINLGWTVTKLQCLMELHLLKQTIQATRLQAMARGEDQVIVIDIENNQYIKDGTTTTFGQLSIPKAIEIPQVTDEKTLTPCSFAHNTITCFKSGVISAGTLYFHATDDKSLFFCLSCPVSQANYIHVYEYNNGWISHS